MSRAASAYGTVPVVVLPAVVAAMFAASPKGNTWDCCSFSYATLFASVFLKAFTIIALFYAFCYSSKALVKLNENV